MMEYQVDVSGNGDTLWVNANDGSCVARFSKRFGIDVHNSVTAQLAGASQCLFCTHAPAGPEEWKQFRESVKKNFGVDVPADIIKF